MNATAPGHDEEKRRGERARLILTDPLVVEAFNALDRELRMARERVPIKDTDMHTRLIIAEQVQAKVLDFLKGVMESGHAASLILREQQNLARRMADAVVHGIRNIG